MKTSIAPEPAQSLLELPLDKTETAASLQQQLHQRLQTAIFEGRLQPGQKLPGSRFLAERLAISRNTVTHAYDQLAAEGYVLPGRQGTTVVALSRTQLPGARSQPVQLAQRMAQVRPRAANHTLPLALRPGVPDLAHFPASAWRRTLDKVLRDGGPATLNYGNPLGEPGLRTAIARHVALARGLRCEPDQIVITEGAREAVALCIRLLTNPGERIWVEDPGYRGAKLTAHAGDLQVTPLPVDAEGMVITTQDWQKRPPKLIYTTPSHQYPMGAVLGVARRLELLAAAQQHGAWIIEDDYDSEFRHAGQPIGAMQGLIEEAPVLYVGTFNKTMFPALRIGFVVLPRRLMDAASAPLHEMLQGGQRYTQLALTAFMESGQFGRHLGRMRRIYRSRQLALRQALTEHFALPHHIEGGHCGLHLTVRLPPLFDDRQIARQAQQHGMAPAALSDFSLRPADQNNGLVLGYGNTSAEAMPSLIKMLAQITLESAQTSF